MSPGYRSRRFTFFGFHSMDAGVFGPGPVSWPLAAVSAFGPGRWGRCVWCDDIESFAAGISLVLVSNWKNMEDNLVAAWSSVEKNQKILKISLFNWAQMG